MHTSSVPTTHRPSAQACDSTRTDAAARVDRDRWVVALGGSIDPARGVEVAEGRRPRVEYDLLLQDATMELLDFGRLDEALWTRAIRRCFGNYIAVAALGSLRYQGVPILATGEDIGLPLALAQGLRRRNRARLAIICHGSYLESAKLRPVMRILRRREDVVYLCLSASIADQFRNRFDLNPEQVRIVGYGVDTAFFAPVAARDRGRPLVASAGTASRDYRTLVRAMSGIDADLKIAADSEWFPTSVDLDDEPLPAGAEIRSFGDYVGLRALYADASVVVVPLLDTSHAAGYAVIAEAMAMGKVVVASAGRSTSDFIVDGVSGYLVPPGDPAALAAVLRRVLADEELRTGIGLAARERIMSSASVERYAQQLRENLLR